MNRIGIFALATLLVGPGVVGGSQAVAGEQDGALKEDVLVVRYALLLGGRSGIDAPTASGILSREELSDLLLEWEPGVDNQEVREVFALNALGELARQAAQLPLAGGVVSGAYAHGDERFEIDMNIRPAKSMDDGEEVMTVQAEIQRDGELVAGPMILARLGERVVTTSSAEEEGSFLFLVVEVDRLSAEDVARRGLRHSWRDDYKLVDGEDVTAPVVLEKVQPVYTEKARQEKQQGKVLLRMIINEEGTVEDVEVIEGQPYGLTETAVDAARQWRFEPALYRGEPVAVIYLVTVNFRLE
jgi:TonB family protein